MTNEQLRIIERLRRGDITHIEGIKLMWKTVDESQSIKLIWIRMGKILAKVAKRKLNRFRRSHGNQRD